MKYKKNIVFLIVIIFLFSIVTVSASDVNDTGIVYEDTNQIRLTASNEIDVDNLQINDEHTTLGQTQNDEVYGVGVDSEIVGDSSGKYSGLIGEIGSGGNIELQYNYYTYDSGSTITITVDNTVIDGKGAVIDMAGSKRMLVFDVMANGVIIKNLIIKNAYSMKGVISFNYFGTMMNCNFVNNTAYRNGGAVYMMGDGNLINCNFTHNIANNVGGAVFLEGFGNVTNCNFVNNSAKGDGAISMNSGTVINCNFTRNKGIIVCGAIFLEYGNLLNCNFVDNSANDYGGAVYMCSGNMIK